MIGKLTRILCKEDLSLIENYDKAMADNTQVWVIHHRLETHKYKDRSRKEWIKRDECLKVSFLKLFGLYYNRPACELIFMTRSDHQTLHMNMVSQEYRDNMRNSCMGDKNGFYGKKHSEEARKKMRAAAAKRKPWTEERRKASSERSKKMWQDEAR